MIGRFGMTRFTDLFQVLQEADWEEEMLCNIKKYARNLQRGDKLTVIRGDDGRLQAKLVRPVKDGPNADPT